jgi:dihydroorotase
MSVAPARIFSLPGGTLTPGAIADVTVFDPDREWVVDPARFYSKGKNSPLAGVVLRGQVTMTIVGGDVVYEARQL